MVPETSWQIAAGPPGREPGEPHRDAFSDHSRGHRRY
jgi:hypothetical protein